MLRVFFIYFLFGFCCCVVFAALCGGKSMWVLKITQKIVEETSIVGICIVVCACRELDRLRGELKKRRVGWAAELELATTAAEKGGVPCDALVLLLISILY